MTYLYRVTNERKKNRLPVGMTNSLWKRHDISWQSNHFLTYVNWIAVQNLNVIVCHVWISMTKRSVSCIFCYIQLNFREMHIVATQKHKKAKTISERSRKSAININLIFGIRIKRMFVWFMLDLKYQWMMNEQPNGNMNRVNSICVIHEHYSSSTNSFSWRWSAVWWTQLSLWNRI